MEHEKNRQYVYLLWHVHALDEEEEDAKLLGVYSSEALAKGKINEFKKQPGFKDFPEEFLVDCYEIDRDHWKEGFVTVT